MAAWSAPGVVHLREVREDSVGRRVVARHHITRRSLAVTYLSHELLTDTQFRTRFAREFARLARVRDSRVAGVHRYVECQQGAAVIGDHVHGMSLRDLLLAHGAVGAEAALVVLSDLLRGLAACHAAGLAHGDIKPEGVILTPSGRVRLVDFGLWTAHGRRLLAHSTPFYLAPEQWSGQLATPAGDLYAAAVTFFECLVGAPPFYGDRSAELSAKHEQCTPPIDAIAGPVRELVRGGLAKDPHRRPEARNLLAEVAEVAAQVVGAGWEQRGRRELARLSTNRSALPEMTMPDDRRGAGSEHRRPIRLAAVVGGALVLAAGLASPPLAVILPGGSVFGSSARPPVLAFPEPAPGTSPVRAVTKGSLADRPVHTAPGAKVAPAGQPPVARARPGKENPLAPSIPGANPEIAIGEHPRPSVHGDEAARARSASARACTSTPMAEHQPCAAPAPGQQTPWSTEMESGTVPWQVPSSIGVPGSIEVPTSLQVSIPVLDGVQPLKDIQPLRNVQPPKIVQPPKDVQSEKKVHPQKYVQPQKKVQPPRNSEFWTAPRVGEQTERARRTEWQSTGTAKRGGSTGEQPTHGKRSSR